MSYLVDTSAWHRVANPAVSARWKALVVSDEIWICDQVALEVLYSARSSADYLRTDLNLGGFHYAPIDQLTYVRAREVQHKLALVGALHHRSVNIADLVIAAVAELNGLTVLHYNEDFDRISAATNQPTEWIVARDSI